MKAPTISVIMSVHNGADYLRCAVDSVLAQTYGSFEFIIIDDGSTDETSNILRTCKDRRIVHHTNETNMGLTRSLKLGCELARGQYIARLDADDVSAPNRFREQIRYLTVHPEIALLGSAYDVIDESGARVETRRVPASPLLVDWHLLFGNPVAHSSIMCRRDVITSVGGYDARVKVVQDYDLWSRICAGGHRRIALLDQPLIQLRRHHSQIGQVQKSLSQEMAIRIAAANVGRLVGEVPDGKVMVCLANCGHTESDPDVVARAYQLFETCLSAYMLTRANSIDERNMLLQSALPGLLKLARLSEAQRFKAMRIVVDQAFRHSLVSLLSPEIVTFAARVAVPFTARRHLRLKLAGNA
jgi:glycosyltransferase involved in cell wall biosynthesis